MHATTVAIDLTKYFLQISVADEHCHNVETPSALRESSSNADWSTP